MGAGTQLIANPFELLLQALGALPGIGPKSAQRIAYYLLARPVAEVETLIRGIMAARERLRLCERCFFMAWDQPLCSICSDPRRLPGQLLVVAEAKDLMALEKLGSYHGYYHVLGGVLSPLHNVGAADLHLESLLKRLSEDKAIQELIFALPQTVEAEATRSYILQGLGKIHFKLSQLATGLPVGGDLDYIDRLTLNQALKQRVILSP